MAATVWKGHLSFGLITIPVTLSRAARAERVNLRELYRAATRDTVPSASENVIELPAPPAKRGRTQPEPQPAPAPVVPPPVERVRHVALPESGDQPIERGELVKGYEYAPEQWAIVEKDDLKSIAPETSKTIDIREFVPFAEIDPLYLETSYYVAPAKAAAKPYALLYRALRDTGRAAVAELAMHRREHVLILRAGRGGIVAHTMFYEDEIRREEEYRADLDLVTQRELDLAIVLIEALAAPFEPGKYRDRYRERLEAMIAAKVAGREVAQAAPPPPPKPDVTDMLAALEKSLELVRKKPPAPAAAPAPRKRGSARK